MFQGFLKVVSVPKSKRLIAFGFMARSPMGMRVLAVLLFVEHHTDSYLLAGSTMAAMTTAQALVGPALGRTVDIYGPTRVLLVTAGGHGAFGSGLAIAIINYNSVASLVLLAFFTGATVAPIGAIVRGRWTSLLREQPDHLRTAYSIESSADELIYIGGPLVTVGLAHAVSPLIGFLLTMVVTVLGSVLLSGCGVLNSYPAERRAIRQPTPSLFSLSLWRVPGFPMLLLSYAGLGLFLGAVDVSVVATAGPQAGVVLSVLGIASLSAALALGLLPTRWNLHWVRPVSGLLIAATCAGAFWADSLVLLAGLMAVAGLAISPTLILGADAMRSISPPRQISEAFTWSSSTITAFLGVGSFASGWLTDTTGAHLGYAVAVLGGLLTATSGLRMLASFNDEGERIMTPSVKVVRRGDVDISVTDYDNGLSPVVLLHGLAGSGRELRPTAEALSDSFRVMLMDQRAHGRSTRRPADLSRQAFVDDVVYVVEQLAPGQRVGLVGQSMGAHTAFLTASKRPDLVHRLVMLEGHVAGEETGETARAIGTYFASWPTPFHDRAAAHAFLGDSPLAQAWVEDLESTPSGLRPRFDADIMEHTITAVHEPYWEEWEQLTVPAIAVFGEESMFSPVKQEELIRRRPGTDHAVIECAGHDAHLENPGGWITVVRRYLQSPTV